MDNARYWSDGSRRWTVACAAVSAIALIIGSFTAGIAGSNNMTERYIACVEADNDPVHCQEGAR